MIIAPIDIEQQQLVCKTTEDYISKACDLFHIRLDAIPVYFDLKGRASGMYRVKKNDACIRYNPYLFAKYFDDNILTTVPHEVAHYVTDRLYGLRNIKPHGTEWRSVMYAFGAEARATGDYDLTGIPVRQQRRYDYHCTCSTHRLGTRRHNKILKNQARYYCRKCGSQIQQL